MGQLDGRLQVLEDASEKGEMLVSPRLAQIVGQGLPCIAVGMPITDALEAVFQEQETVLVRRSNGLSTSSDVGRPGAPVRLFVEAPANKTSRTRLQRSNTILNQPKSSLDVRAAEVLTQRIKTEISHVCLLLAEAHDRRAWAVLGHPTWDQYVRNEFGYSRSRSYEILDQARVVRAIQEAAGSASIPDLSAYAARQIKPYLQQVVNEIRDRVAAAGSRREYKEIVNQVVARARSMAALSAQHAPAVAATRRREADNCSVECGKIFVALDFLADLPPPSDEFLAAIRKEPQELLSLRSAATWLLNLARCIELPAPSAQSVGNGDSGVAAVSRQHTTPAPNAMQTEARADCPQLRTG